MIRGGEYYNFNIMIEVQYLKIGGSVAQMYYRKPSNNFVEVPRPAIGLLRLGGLGHAPPAMRII